MPSPEWYSITRGSLSEFGGEWPGNECPRRNCVRREDYFGRIVAWKRMAGKECPTFTHAHYTQYFNFNSCLILTNCKTLRCILFLQRMRTIGWIESAILRSAPQISSQVCAVGGRGPAVLVNGQHNIGTSCDVQ